MKGQGKLLGQILQKKKGFTSASDTSQRSAVQLVFHNLEHDFGVSPACLRRCSELETRLGSTYSQDRCHDSICDSKEDT